MSVNFQYLLYYLDQYDMISRDVTAEKAGTIDRRVEYRNGIFRLLVEDKSLSEMKIYQCKADLQTLVAELPLERNSYPIDIQQAMVKALNGYRQCSICHEWYQDKYVNNYLMEDGTVKPVCMKAECVKEAEKRGQKYLDLNVKTPTISSR